MKLILSTFLRTLKERNEFDALLPDLLLSMGIVPLSRPQTGTRQFGVDLSGVGVDVDGVEKLFLFVLKKGDIGRRTWDGDGPQSVQSSLNEIFDVYLRSHIATKYSQHQVKVILSTTGDLKDVVQPNWAGYTKGKEDIAEFDFWGADDIAVLIERHMLDEHLFQSEDRTDLRRALALVGEPEYSLVDFHNLLLRQLGLSGDGQLVPQQVSSRDLVKAIIRTNLTTRIIGTWAANDGDTKIALKASERALLWTWWRILQTPENGRAKLISAFTGLIETYLASAAGYVEKIEPHSQVRDGFSGYAGESTVLSLSVFEHIGLLASIGLSIIYFSDASINSPSLMNSGRLSDVLLGVIRNNPVSGSPSLDEHSIDITLALSFLAIMGKKSEAKGWLGELVGRVDFSYKMTRNFPIGTDSLDDLVELGFGEPTPERKKELMSTSWTLAILAGWSIIFAEEPLYNRLVVGQGEEAYPEVCSQLWHPVSEDFFNHLHFHQAHYACGEAEAPIKFHEDMGEYRKNMEAIIVSGRHKVVEASPSFKAGFYGLDLIAMRHFRTPVPPSFWYQFLSDD